MDSDCASNISYQINLTLFLIPLDDKGQWYRYLHLFAELLLDQLCQSGPEQITELHQHPSQWYKNHHMYSDAIKHAIASTNFKRDAAILI